VKDVLYGDDVFVEVIDEDDTMSGGRMRRVRGEGWRIEEVLVMYVSRPEMNFRRRVCAMHVVR
jgi:hypothetical protein